MKQILLAVMAASVGCATAANAGITLSAGSGPNFWTFDDDPVGATSGTSNTIWGPITFYTTGGGVFGSPQGAVEDQGIPGYAAQPDPSNYLFAAGGGSATVLWSTTLTSFDIYWGSIDPWNTLTLSNGDFVTGTDVLSALSLPGEVNAWVQISDSTPFTGFTASASQPAFEFDLPGTIPPVTIPPVQVIPEPSTWAMMGLGFAELAFIAFRRAKARVAIV